MALADCPAAFATSVTLVKASTGWVDAVNVADVAPAATVTVAGTETIEGVLDVRLIVKPPLGATAFRVTVPVTLKPPD
jgi:hypothetical protein